jgi:hypothetical protein
MGAEHEHPVPVRELDDLVGVAELESGLRRRAKPVPQ